MDFRAVTVRGYAATFNQIIEFGGALEYIDRDAFAGFLRPFAAVAVNFGTHDLAIIGNSRSLFADDYGLGFEATLDCSARE